MTKLITDFKVGDIIEFKFYENNYVDKRVDWKKETAKIEQIVISHNPDHIPHRLGVTVAKKGLGIRLDEVLSHTVVAVGQQELF